MKTSGIPVKNKESHIASEDKEEQPSILDSSLLGDSGGVVNSLDFCPAMLKSLGCFCFRCVLSSQWNWNVVTVNLRILLCQL